MAFARGDRLGNYEILRRLGEGGMAEIYVARTHVTEGVSRLVALKQLRSVFAGDGELIRMFVDEAKLSAALQHPGIAQVFEVGGASRSPYFAMELVHGETLRALVAEERERGGSVPVAHVAAVALQTAAALSHAHAKGIVHRDVSTSNVMISYDGAVKLLDFGIAKAASRATVTAAGTLRGTLVYMAPEQSTGGAVDGRSDLFSLGLVLFELLTGRRPFDGDGPVAIAAQIALVDVPPPSTLGADVPEAIEEVLLRALRRDPAQRYESAEAFELAFAAACAEARVTPSTSASLRLYMRETFGDRADTELDDEGEVRPSSIRIPTATVATSGVTPTGTVSFVVSEPNVARPADADASARTGGGRSGRGAFVAMGAALAAMVVLVVTVLLVVRARHAPAAPTITAASPTPAGPSATDVAAAPSQTAALPTTATSPSPRDAAPRRASANAGDSPLLPAARTPAAHRRVTTRTSADSPLP